jgi:hypothetical protein
MKNGIFWDVTPSGFCMGRRFGRTYRHCHLEEKIGELGTTLAASSNLSTLRRTTLSSKVRLLVTADFVLSSLILSILMKEAIRFSETSVLRRATRHQILEDGIL